MKKILISIGAVLVIGLYALFASHQNQTVVINNPTPSTTTSQETTSSQPTQTTGNNPPVVTPPVTTPVLPPKQTGQYKDGSYTGPVTDAIYGNIQVVASVKNGS